MEVIAKMLLSTISYLYGGHDDRASALDLCLASLGHIFYFFSFDIFHEVRDSLLHHTVNNNNNNNNKSW